MRSQSFLQDQRHETKSQKFVPIKPELIETVLSPHGFTLQSLKTGRALLPERANHQTTIARYRSNTEMKIGGHYLEIVAKVPHLYGAVELFLGTYRVVCSNGLTVGTKFVSYKVKHLGSPLDQIKTLLPQLVAQERAMSETIQEMQARQLTSAEISTFAWNAAQARLAGVDNIRMISSNDLLSARRGEDADTSLYSVFNRIQENLTRYSLRYQIETTDVNTGITLVRNQTARKLGGASVKALGINQVLWDKATEFLKAA